MSPDGGESTGPVPGSLTRIALRHLSALQAIAREGSFRGAAESLGYVQSAVSGQIADLERLVGMRLVQRSRGNTPVSMTPGGLLLLEHAVEILTYFEAAQADLEGLREGRAGRLRVGTFQSVASSVLPSVTAQFMRTCPGFVVDQTLADVDIPLLAKLEDGELDLAFCELPCDDRPFERVELFEDPMVLLVADRSPLLDADGPPRLSQLAGLPFIGFHAASRVHPLIIERLAEHGLELNYSYRVDLNTTLQAFVAADLGVAIVPRLAVDTQRPGTTVIELPELPARQISLAWHRDRERSRGATEFVKAAQAIAPRMRERRVMTARQR